MHCSYLRKAVLLTAALMLIFCFSAFAATVFVTEDTTVYAKPDEDSKAYGTLETGFKANMTASGYGWARLEVSGKVGYVKLDDVAKLKNYNGVRAYTVCAVKLTSDLEGEKVIATLEEGQEVRIYAIAGEWVYVKVDGKAGIVDIDSLTLDKPETAPEKEDEPAKTITAYVKKDGVKAYAKASASSKVLCTLKTNDTVTVTAVKNGWATVEKNGHTGYMKTADLSTEKIDVIVQENYTGYANKDGVKAYNSWNDSASVVKTFKVNDKVEVSAYNSKWARVTVNGEVMYMHVSSISRTKLNVVPDNGSTTMPATGKAKAADWWTSDISTLFAVGDVVTITDVETGIAWKVKRTGGTNHADVQPLTAADTAAMKKACGKWSWDRRAIFVTVDGVNYAASMNCMPHGSGNSIPDNDFNGHHCIHFTNSRTHGTNSKCSLHQAAIQKALNADLK